MGQYAAPSWVNRAARDYFGGGGRHLLLLLIPVTLFFFGVNFLPKYTYNDPTSAFFNPIHAYGRKYSNVRLAESKEFIKSYNATGAPDFRREFPVTPANPPPFLCATATTVVRPSGAIYFPETIGSLLSGLSQKERDQIYLMPLFGHTNQSEHPVFGQPWVGRVTDRILSYADSEMDSKDRAHVTELEAEYKKTGIPDREKMMFDYSYAIKACAATKAPYILYFEDDVAFADGWFHRTKRALFEAEQKTKNDKRGFFYLRLFYISKKEWPEQFKLSYFRTSAVLLVIFLLIWRFSRPTFAQSLRQKSANKGGLIAATVLTTYVVYTWLYFSAGVELAHGPERGVFPMNSCCAQATIFPNRMVEPLTDWYRERRIGFVDELAEKVANEKPDVFGPRFYVKPALVQHVGSKSSKGDNWGSDKPGQMAEAERVWNFGFEAWSQKRLAEDHKNAVAASAGLQRRGAVIGRVA
ncbi:hypothetical protein MCOR27_010146 [Pyricularia oryzae]|uniref:Integral membrane protein n=2 Tax=Pyricularia TaxID=48558 RepID=A0ABQ8NC63_PYRGI|nr:hypothetical protein MCOR02_000182 [Pyricularia oryzae]KAI6294715.1 hypothetical protein MCOR33_008219 [Pyricularia grisea]KAI6256413.1 hypothetical protein MCOR19_007132 [Pyricularia oryzae]KAI6268470.1 hypothetical protein MCOR27_010146 [Pyricularia oryzae]KAI6269881.1 hypothetical protein MCOR26_008496 [Pyricularia oryzae]